jgi:hypothetical protein
MFSWLRRHFSPVKVVNVIKRHFDCASVEHHNTNTVYVAAEIVAPHLVFPELGRLPPDRTDGGRKYELIITILILRILQHRIVDGDSEVNDF